jgi:uncharacterized protein
VRSVSIATARRYILGRQGLWPGRRWKGRRGVEFAIGSIGSVQFDPLDVVGRSHDLALWGRIVDYRSEFLSDALYERRSVFETGGNVQIRPAGELPYFRLAMSRTIAKKRWVHFARVHRQLIARVMREIEARGPLSAGNFQGPEERRISNYRASTESGLALHYLWQKGDIMIASRRGGEKVFDLVPRLFPGQTDTIPVAQAEEHLILGMLAQLGLASGSEWLAYAHTRIARSTLRREWRERIHQWQEQGTIEEVEVEGWSGTRWLLSEGGKDLDLLESDRVPSGWKPISPTTTEEAVFLAPLEWVTARGRAKRLFNFDYVWEVYKPPSKRRWGYYTLPILWKDELPARIELKFHRPARKLVVQGFWLEGPSLRRNSEFASALGKGLARLADFLGAESVDTKLLRPLTDHARVDRVIRESRPARSA